MELTVDALDRHIPYYLTAEQKVGLTKELENFESNDSDYYIQGYGSQMLQGDGWAGFNIYSQRGKKTVRGVVVSNSCDISPENQRAIPPKVTFAPIINLDRYQELLRDGKLSDSQIDNKIDSIRKQKLTELFYLPDNKELGGESVVLLSDVQSISRDELAGSVKKFTLSMFGFYMFVFKLSIHFCRFHENVDRSASRANS